MRKIAFNEPGGRGRAWWRVLAAVTVLAPAAFAQGMGGGMGRGLPSTQAEPGENGFGFYGVAAYAGWTSTAVPFNATFPVSGLGLGPNYLAGGSASMGWADMGALTDAHISYTISYDASLRYSTWNTLNHNLNFGVVHEVSPRLTFHFSGNAATMRWDQFLFEPTVLGELADTSSTFDELVSAILSGKYTNSQLASILTGAPTLESPAATLLYGTRFFTSSLRTGLEYALSPRLHIHGDAGGSRIQHLNSDTAQANGIYLVPATTTATATAGLDYAFSPFTTIGVSANGNRTFSRYEDAYITTVTATANRVLGRHWILNGRGGAGTFVPVRQTFKYGSGLHYVAGGGITYKAENQSVMLQYVHTIQDTSGIAAQSADTGSGIWQVHRPGHHWTVYTRGSYSMLRGSTLSNINAWLAGGGVGRMLNGHTNAMLGYMYGRDSGVIGSTVENRALQAVNLVVSWTPHAMPY